MPAYVFTFDPSAAAGERLAPQLREEISVLAPSTLNDGAVAEQKLQDGSVTHPKLAADAVQSGNIAAGQVLAVNLGSKAVTGEKLDDACVTPPKVGLGVVTSQDSGGSPVELRLVPITALEFSGIVTPDPAVVYLVLEDE